MRLFLHHCISDGNQLFSEHFGYHCNFIFYVMSDKAGFVSGALLCVQRYRGNLELSRYNREFIFIFHLWISVCYTNILLEFLLKCSAIKSIKNLLKNLNFLWLWTNEWNAFVRVSLHLESRSRKTLEKQYLLLCFQFQLVSLVSSKRLYDIHVTWFDRFLWKGRQRRITINYHSCFHSCWPN